MSYFFSKYNFIFSQKICTITLFSIFFSLALTISGSSQDLGKGYFDHGVTSSISHSRGMVATIDRNGQNVALVWLFDHRGGYALLMIDAETGKSEQFPMPFPAGDAPYSSILSAKNKFYTLFKSYFVEFDPVKRAFTFSKEVMPQMAMGMTEDDKGMIWAVTYPNSGLVSFNPNSQQLTDYGYLYKQNWAQYPVNLAADDNGWIYFGLGNTASQIIAFDPVSGTAKPMLTEAERKRGSAYVYRDLNGKVYGKPLKNDKEGWYEFYKGNGRKIGPDPEGFQNLRGLPGHPKPFISGNQGLFHREFPDGKIIKDLDLKERKLIVEDRKTNTEKQVSFDYTSEGGWTMGVIATPDGKIAGGVSFPMRSFSYDPKKDSWTNDGAIGQFNALAKQGDRIYFGVYPQGALLEWNPSMPWVTRKEGNTNPEFLASSGLLTHRPHRILPYSDGNTIIMSGTPEYGYTGGGLLFWDRKKKTQTVLQDSAIVLDQSTMSMVALPGGKLLGGTTTAPGTGGEKKAKEAELYIMDVNSKRLEWHQIVFPGVQSYSDMCAGPDGLIYGITDYKKFFVFDPAKKMVIHQQDCEASFGRTASSQSPRIFVVGPEKEIYMLFNKGIVSIEPGSFKLTMLTESPVPINIGGDYLDGRIYFVSGSHLCSYKL